jgi:hypothetical protein
MVKFCEKHFKYLSTFSDLLALQQSEKIGKLLKKEIVQKGKAKKIELKPSTEHRKGLRYKFSFFFILELADYGYFVIINPPSNIEIYCFENLLFIQIGTIRQ